MKKGGPYSFSRGHVQENSFDQYLEMQKRTFSQFLIVMKIAMQYLESIYDFLINNTIL